MNISDKSHQLLIHETDRIKLVLVRHKRIGCRKSNKYRVTQNVIIILGTDVIKIINTYTSTKKKELRVLLTGYKGKK
jgi:hypothetical protein